VSKDVIDMKRKSEDYANKKTNLKIKKVHKVQGALRTFNIDQKVLRFLLKNSKKHTSLMLFELRLMRLSFAALGK